MKVFCGYCGRLLLSTVTSQYISKFLGRLISHLGQLSVFFEPLNTLLLFAVLLYCIRYDTRCYFNVRSKADMSQLNLPHGMCVFVLINKIFIHSTFFVKTIIVVDSVSCFYKMFRI